VQTETTVITLLTDMRDELAKLFSDLRADFGRVEARIEKREARVKKWVIISGSGILVSIACAIAIVMASVN
jgi:hypothetical protein